MGIELNGVNDIVRRNGNLPDEVLATKAGPSLSAEEVAYLESLPHQSKLKQAYLASTAKTELQGYQVPQLQALVSVAGVANGTLLAEQAPNTLLTDTDTLLRQLGFITIPGGKMSVRTRLEIGVVTDLTGNDSKNITLWAGPSSGTFATATGFGGLIGLTTQKYTPLLGLVWADNSLTALRANPVGQGDWPRASAANASRQIAIDTNLDWNIYVGFQSAIAGGAPANSATLRNIWARVIG